MDKDHETCVPLKEFLTALMNERERKWDQRFDGIQDQINDGKQLVKEALITAEQGLEKSLQGVDQRFQATMEVRRHLEQTVTTLALKSEVMQAMESSEKAIAKAEAAAEKRFDAVNEFRAQLADQQNTFVRKNETDIRFEAVNQKLDAAIISLQTTKGEKTGFNAAWSVLAIILTLALSGVGVAVAIVMKQ